MEDRLLSSEAPCVASVELISRVEELQRANQDLRSLIESTRIAMLSLDRFMLIRWYTAAATSIFNLSAADLGRKISDIAHRLVAENLSEEFTRVLDAREPVERQVRLRDSKSVHLMRVLPHLSAQGELDGALVTFVDITAIMEGEEQQRVLVAELNHRVRNMLQVVMGLANQSLHRATDLKHFEQSFTGRMQGLARAYELLTRERWQKVPLADLVRSQLSPFVTEGQRFTALGPPLVLKSNTALALGLVLYELATNATKYGALSVPSGCVQVNWGLESGAAAADHLVVRWEESGGPAVKYPARHGFGSELVQRQLRYELSGTAKMEFLESGLRVTVWIPVDEAIEG